MDASRWEQLGVYDPNAPEAEDHLKVLEYVTELGATEEELVEAYKNKQTLGDLALDLILRPAGRMLTFEEAVTAAGIDRDEAARFIRALGFPDPRYASHRLPEQYVEHLAQILKGSESFLGPQTTLAIARVMGSTAFRLAEALTDAFRTNFEGPQRQQGVTYSQIVRSYGELTQALLPVFLDAFEATFKDHLVQIASGGWSFDEETGTRDLVRAPGGAGRHLRRQGQRDRDEARRPDREAGGGRGDVHLPRTRRGMPAGPRAHRALRF
jgi:hypothetical protein